MNKTEIMNNISRKIHTAGFKLKKHSPEILAAAGVIGIVTSTVMACRATTKASTILDNAKHDIERIHEVAEDPTLAEEYTEEDNKKDLAIVYAQTGIQLVKLYAPAAVVGVVSIGAMLGSNKILRQRNAALAASYVAVEKSYNSYRERVRERFGDELDKELRYNIKAREYEEKIVNEKGKEKTVKKTIEVMELDEPSDFSRFFDDGCLGWTKDSEYNLSFLKGQQAFLNTRLEMEGYLFLNDVYELLGIPKSKAGQIAGWVHTKENPMKVDFGIYNGNREANRNFVNGYERTILLDFNCCGNILDYL